MTEAATDALNLPLPGGDTGASQWKRSIRRLGDFSRSVEFALAEFNRRYGTQLELSRRDLTRAFLEWVRRFDAQRELAARDPRDFSHFSAGLLLGSLVRNRPVRRRPAARPAVATPAASGPEERLVAFWPEGVFYFEFCITVLDKVLAEQRLEGIHLAPEALELRSWWSFRENVANDPDQAVAFLDLFLQGDPVWDMPTAARFRSAMRDHLLRPERRLSEA
ncbi:hypothetical protein [Aureimonas sp. AU4]|uniref:hypothetical protein n=1 Tax=Aureimonas sp. AU4 TaxID=1638163 RepID=UPI000781C0E4|nr:hypothetical protein [Aureimonas sp. AU4]